MAIWEQATLTDGPDPGDRVDVDAEGISWVKILSPSFRLNDGNDFTYVGFGNRIIQIIEED